MPTDTGLSEARDLTLQKVGRNVVNFQRMEAMLKFILKFAEFTAAASDTEERLGARERLHRTKAMGHLVDLAAKAQHGAATPASVDDEEVWVRLSFTLGEGSQMRQWRKELRRVVQERNALIQRMLAAWDPGSIENCRTLCHELDAQRDRIVPAYQHLESVVKAIRESHEELARNVDAFVTTAFNERARARTDLP